MPLDTLADILLQSAGDGHSWGEPQLNEQAIRSIVDRDAALQLDNEPMPLLVRIQASDSLIKDRFDESAPAKLDMARAQPHRGEVIGGDQGF